MIFQAAVPPDSASAQGGRQSEPAPTGSGGLGGLGRMRGKKNDQPAAGAGTPGRTTVLTTTSETLQLTPSATEADVALPTGLKLEQ